MPFLLASAQSFNIQSGCFGRKVIGYEYSTGKAEAYSDGTSNPDVTADSVVLHMSIPAPEKAIEKVTKEMKVAAKELDFITIAQLRDEMYRL